MGRDHGARALVRNRRHLDAGHGLEELGGEVLRGADRDGADLQLTWVRFRVQPQITQRREALAIRNEYPEIEEAEGGDRRQVPDGVVRFLNSPTLMALLLLINKRVYPSDGRCQRVLRTFTHANLGLTLIECCIATSRKLDMQSTLAFIALIVVVAGRIYFGRLAAQIFDSLPEAERKRINSAIAAGTY